MNTPYSQGYSAGFASQEENPYYSNPYEEGSNEFFEWERGMRAAFGLDYLDK